MTLSVTRYQDSTLFLTDMQQEIGNDTKRELDNMLFLWAIIRLSREQPDQLNHSSAYGGAVWRQEDKKKLIFAMVMRENDSVYFSSLFTQDIEKEGREAVALIVQDLGVAIPTDKIASIDGDDNATLQLVKENLQMLPSIRFDSRFAVWSYTIRPDAIESLTKKALAKKQEGYFLRKATYIELPHLIDWMTDYYLYYKEYFPSEAFVQQLDQIVFKRCTDELRLGNIYFYCASHGLPVSMIWQHIPLHHGTSIGYVYTPPKSRKQGLGGAMVSAFCIELLKKYKYINITVEEKQNPKDNMYTRVGFGFEGARYCYRLNIQ